MKTLFWRSRVGTEQREGLETIINQRSLQRGEKELLASLTLPAPLDELTSKETGGGKSEKEDSWAF